MSMERDLGKPGRRERVLKQFWDGQVIPAIPLCLDEHRQFDEAGQRSLVRYYLESGAGGIAAAVHTTQFAIRNPKSRLFERVLQTTADEIERFEQENDVTIIRVSGVCGDEKQAVEEAGIARNLGFDLVLLSPSGRTDDAEEVFLRRSRAVSEVLPLIGFSMQTAVGGRLFSEEFWREFVSIPGSVGVKAAPFNRYETISIARAAALSGRGERFALYTGNDDNIVVDLLTPFVFKDADGNEHEIRFKGGLLGQWSVWTEGAVRLFGELKEIRKSGRQEIPLSLLTRGAQLTEANGAVFDYRGHFAGCIAGVHQTLVNDGLMKGIWTLDPEEGLSPGQAEAIKRAAGDYPHLTDNKKSAYSIPLNGSEGGKEASESS